MATRSFAITLLNQTGWPLQITANSGFEHGNWSHPVSMQAPASIANEAQVTFQSEDYGVMTGVQGRVTYQILDDNPLTPDGVSNNMVTYAPTTSWLYIYWDNPYGFGQTQINVHMATNTDQTMPIDYNGDYINSNQFNVAPPVSMYEVFYTPIGGGGPSAGWNWGAAIPVIGLGADFGAVFLDSGIIANATVTILVIVKATDLITWSKRHKVDLTKGLRALNPPNGSLRSLLQLPPAPIDL
jgi:hypothetical protein